jgi:hypothetical protein
MTNLGDDIASFNEASLEDAALTDREVERVRGILPLDLTNMVKAELDHDSALAVAEHISDALTRTSSANHDTVVGAARAASA